MRGHAEIWQPMDKMSFLDIPGCKRACTAPATTKASRDLQLPNRLAGREDFRRVSMQQQLQTLEADAMDQSADRRATAVG
jgi:hypothetical protein